MSTRKRKPSVATQLKDLRAEHAAVQQQTIALQKEIDTLKQRAKYTTDAKEAAESELAQMHVLLDALPNPIPRKAESIDGFSTPTHPCSTRLAAWLAVRSTL